MKRQLISLIIILPLLALFTSPEVYAQSGTGELTGAKPATPTPKPNPKVSRTSSPRVLTRLTLGEEKEGRLDPRDSDKNEDGTFSEEMIFSAKSDDLLAFRIEGGNPSVGLRILGKDGAEVAVAKDSSGDFKIATATGGVPADGEYRVRVTGAIIGRNPVPFTLKVSRLGLTTVAYAERYQKIYSNYRESDPASVDETVAKLEELGREDSYHPFTFQLLGLIYLYTRKDLAKAEWAMEQALKANGTAVFKISFDNRWRQMRRMRSGDFGFEDARSGWLRISPGKLTISDLSEKELASLSGLQIKELSKNLISTHNLVTIAGENGRKPYIFAPDTGQEAEADLIIRLIQNHVIGKAN